MLLAAPHVLAPVDGLRAQSRAAPAFDVRPQPVAGPPLWSARALSIARPHPWRGAGSEAHRDAREAGGWDVALDAMPQTSPVGTRLSHAAIGAAAGDLVAVGMWGVCSWVCEEDAGEFQGTAGLVTAVVAVGAALAGPAEGLRRTGVEPGRAVTSSLMGLGAGLAVLSETESDVLGALGGYAAQVAVATAVSSFWP